LKRPFSTLSLAIVLCFVALSSRATIDAALQMQLGNPSNASADTNNHDHYLVQRSVEAMDYSDNLGEPNWASWDLTVLDLGDSGRSPNFFVDTNLPPNFYRVGTGEYSGSGFDRGHLCPSADRTDTTNDNNAVFFMSNMMPQTPDNNSGVWGNFEGYCRSLVQSSNNYELLIICGPSGFTGARINTNGHVAIPGYTWKIVVVVPPGTNSALNRITATNRVIAIKVSNTNGVSSVWQNFITSANQIQVDTGLTFFTALPSDIAGALRIKVDGQTNPPPLIFSFSPTSGGVGTNVIIIGTNFGSASAVAFNGASAAFSVDSGAQITALVPTNAGSGFVSVTTPSGTAISTNSFTLLNNGGSVYNGVLVGWDFSGLSGGLNSYGPSPMPPTTNAPNLSIVGLSRGAGVKTSGTAGAGGWGGNNFTNLTAAAAIGSNQFATFSLTASNGYKVSCAAISRYDYRCTGTGPTSVVLQYQVGTAAFVDVTNLTYDLAANGATNPPIDLSGIAALQNVGANTNITFRIVNYGGTSAAGNWYVFDFAGNTALDLTIQGTVTQVLTNQPAIAPSLASVTMTNHQFQFSITGTSGTNYVVQASTNLSSTNWISLITNAAPFVFTETNAFHYRFYRALLNR
jgi:DNA/RNA endonuclease G (NUC1)